ncbi:TPA: NUDIX hydrolase [Burkholderia contaminans]|uniref:NUDIX hydrolase n=1 Tax=Burkholderia contaminans TaxID=488447 RepID=UPI0027E364C3|nr:NUDIX hydrolase [Burkholderia contaminans]
MAIPDETAIPSGPLVVNLSVPCRPLRAAFFYPPICVRPCNQEIIMKERATVLCRRGDRILLVARLNTRWALPGGKPRPGESLRDAARRELLEETGLVCGHARHLFRIAGTHKLHHVFLADIAPDAIARPMNEIAHCAWIDAESLGSLNCSQPTPLIVELAFDWLRQPRLVPGVADLDVFAGIAA